jgi:hypothetical protein
LTRRGSRARAGAWDDPDVASYVEFIPGAGACIASRNVMSRAGRVRWMIREPSRNRADDGWRIFSHLDTSEYLADAANLQVVAFNHVCAIEPALIGIYDLAEKFYVPPAARA